MIKKTEYQFDVNILADTGCAVSIFEENKQ